MKVLITDPLDEGSVQVLEKEGFEVDHRTGLGEDHLCELIRDADALIVRSGTKVTAKVINSASRLKVIGRAGIGVDNIDVDAATRHGVIVMNTPGGSTVSTAEHTLSLLFALARNIPQADSSVKAGRWERERFVGVEVYGKTIGVIGLGKVGREVARKCFALGMTVIGFDPLVSSDVALKVGVELTSLDELYRRSDFLTFHVPLTSETEKMFGDEELQKSKRGVRIINTARGGIVDENVLVRGLETGQIGGVALDVFASEPPGQHPLFGFENVVATPHLGASTEEAQEKVSAQIVLQVADALKERGLTGVVNAVALQQSFRSEIRPYVQLAEKMGSLEAQRLSGKLRSMTIICCGDLLHQSLELMTAAALRGFLAHLLDGPINYVNASVLAREMGVIVNEKKGADAENYLHLLTLEFETDKEKHSLSGTVFGQENLRLVKIDGFYFEVAPEGYLLFYSNVDRPGMLATVGSILAQSGINIAGVSLGREQVGKNALTVMSLDSPVSESVLGQIRGVEGIFEATPVNL